MWVVWKQNCSSVALSGFRDIKLFPLNKGNNELKEKVKL